MMIKHGGPSKLADCEALCLDCGCVIQIQLLVKTHRIVYQKVWISLCVNFTSVAICIIN
jgi:hypothetical protein